MMKDRIQKTIPTENGRGSDCVTVGAEWQSATVLSKGEGSAVQNPVKNGVATPFELRGSCPHDYIVGLYEQAGALSGKEILEATDCIAEQMKADILAASDETDAPKRAITYYVSEKHGDDRNDGLSPETAVKTLDGLRAVGGKGENKRLLFERGGVYRGVAPHLAPNGVTTYPCWELFPHTTIGAYGEGPKPVWVQSQRNYADPSLWVETEYPNVWRCTEKLVNVGVIGFDHDLFDSSDKTYHERYGIICHYNTFGFMGPRDFSRDLEFYSDFQSCGKKEPAPLYLYSTDGNPGARFSSIEIGECCPIVAGMARDCRIENISFKFTGSHAVSVNVEGLKIRHCIFSWLGGSVLFYDSNNYAVGYGNGVETWECDDYCIEDSWFYQIYDTGVTHQCSQGVGDRVQKHIRYTGNLIEYCHWGIEFYNAPTDLSQYVDGKDPFLRLTEDVRIRYNVVRDTGYGWGSVCKGRMRSSQCYCGTMLSANRDQLTEYNIFDRSAGFLLHLAENSEEIDSKNVYIQIESGTLGNLRGTGRTVCDEHFAENVRDLWGDKEAVVVLIPKDR